MNPSTALQQLFEDPSPQTIDLLLDLCSEFPGIVFAFSARGILLFSGGRDVSMQPLNPRETAGRHYRDVLAGHTQALDHVRRALEGEAFTVKSEFTTRFYETRYAPVRRDGVLLGCIGIAHDITTQTRMEQELKTQQTLYRTVIETTDTGFVMLDNRGLVVDANEEYVRMTGFESVDELRGRSVIEWTAPHDLERNRDEVEKCLRYGITRNLRIDYLDQQGHVVPIEVNATFVYVDGQPRVLALCRDLTEALRDAAELDRHERLSEAVLASVPDPVVVLDGDGRIEVVNESWRAFARQFSFATDENVGVGADYLEIFRRAADEGVQVASTCAAGIRDVVAGRKQRHEQEFSVGHGDERRWYLKRATRLVREHSAVVVMHVDITEHRAAQAAVERSERALRTLLDSAPVGVFQSDVSGECVYVNPAWCRMAGISASEAVGQGWIQALHPDDRVRVFQEWFQATHERRASVIEYRLCSPSGDVRWMHGEAVPIRDAHGAHTGFIGTVSDISSRRAAVRGNATPENAPREGSRRRSNDLG